MFALAMQGVKGAAAPFKKERCHPEAASADRLAAEGSRDAPIVLCASRCWRSGLYCTKKLNIYENENHCVRSKLHSDFVYVDFRMCEQNTLSKLYGNLLQTSSLWHRDALVNGRVTRSFGRICLRARPQDDIVFFLQGASPPAPLLEIANTVA